MSNKTLLIITDGIGHNSSNKNNAFYTAKNQLMIIYLKMYHIH